MSNETETETEMLPHETEADIDAIKLKNAEHARIAAEPFYRFEHEFPSLVGLEDIFKRKLINYRQLKYILIVDEKMIDDFKTDDFVKSTMVEPPEGVRADCIGMIYNYPIFSRELQETIGLFLLPKGSELYHQYLYGFPDDVLQWPHPDPVIIEPDVPLFDADAINNSEPQVSEEQARANEMDYTIVADEQVNATETIDPDAMKVDITLRKSKKKSK